MLLFIDFSIVHCCFCFIIDISISVFVLINTGIRTDLYNFLDIQLKKKDCGLVLAVSYV